jgi:hypothetical protein
MIRIIQTWYRQQSRGFVVGDESLDLPTSTVCVGPAALSERSLSSLQLSDLGVRFGQLVDCDGSRLVE